MATEKVPADDAVPLAVSWVDDTNVVAIEVPANFTCAPLTNWLPFSVMENEPLAKVDGVTLFSAGTGFCRVTVLEDFALESAALTAARVTVFGLGTLAGALYNPDALIVPVLELPPVTPFTLQATPVFELPLTVAVNCWEPPARTFADAGTTDTLTPGGFVPVPAGAVPPHRPSRHATSNTMRRGMRLRMDSPGADHRPMFRFSMGTMPPCNN